MVTRDKCCEVLTHFVLSNPFMKHTLYPLRMPHNSLHVDYLEELLPQARGHLVIQEGTVSHLVMLPT